MNPRKIILKIVRPFFELGRKNALSARIMYSILKKINDSYTKKYLERKITIDIPKDQFKDSVLLICVSFNNSDLIKKQIELFKKNASADHILIIADNSSVEQKRLEIREICERENIFYLDLPENPRKQANLNHSIALNWIYYNFVLNVTPLGFGFIDHDIFPLTEINIKSILREYDAYGLKMELQKKNISVWYLWAGFCFYQTSFISKFKPNFDSVSFSNKSNYLELDTGE